MLYAEPDVTTIFLIAHFAGADPTSDDPNHPIVFPQLTRFDLLHNLFSFYPAAPVGNRRNIKVESPATSKYFSSDINDYLVLKPVKVPMGSTWPILVHDYVTVNKMVFINEVVHDLLTVEKLKLIL